MIPKVIHYCWFGNKRKPKLVSDCILSWKFHLSDYEIIEWNEKNSDLNFPFVKQAYKLKKWAFVADFIRLKVLYENGGIYLDTDMMVVKSFDNLLSDNCFFGSEEKFLISAGIIGSEKNNDFIKACLLNYEFLKIDNLTDFNKITIPILITQTYVDFFKSHSFENSQNRNDVMIYPVPYFYPFPNKKKFDIKNYRNYVEISTYAVHLWSASWVVYDEFDFLRNKQYLKAVSKLLKSIFFENKISFTYLKKVTRHLIYSFTKR